MRIFPRSLFVARPAACNLRFLFVFAVECRLEPGPLAAQTVDHPPGPVEVFAAPFVRPVARRALRDVAQVAGLVRELDGPGPGG